MPIPVDELKSGGEAEFPVESDTAKVDVLRFLMKCSELGFSTDELTDRTELKKPSVRSALHGLQEAGVVDNVRGHYFVEQRRLAEIREFLDELYDVEMPEDEEDGPHMQPVHADRRD